MKTLGAIGAGLCAISVGLLSLQLSEPVPRPGAALVEHDAAAEEMRIARRAVGLVQVRLVDLVRAEVAVDGRFRIELTNMDVGEVGSKGCRVVLVWTLRDAVGGKLGTVHQANTVPVEVLVDAGHREWRRAAQSAATGLRELIRTARVAI